VEHFKSYDEAKVKRFFLRKDHIELWPKNKKYKSQRMDSERCRSRER